MALAVSADSKIHVLDQVNRRISIFENGKQSGQVDLPHTTYEDIAFDSQGRTLLLDRVVSSSIAVVGPTGSIVQNIPITGEGLVEGGAATALITAEDGTWIESEHQTLVRVADASGAVDRDRPKLAGRPSLDEKTLLRAARAGRHSIEVHGLGLTGAPLWHSRLDFPLPARSIRALESDAAGRVYVAVHLLLEQPVAPFDVEEESQVMVVLSATGEELGRIEIAAPAPVDEQFRPIRVTPDGAIYQLVLTESGATVERYSL
jgi:hypothetical protein